MILNFFGNTLYLPPIVSSPKGNPKIRRMLNIITINIKIAPMIAAIYVPSIFLSSKLHIKHLLNICQLFKSHLPLFTNSWIFIFKGSTVSKQKTVLPFLQKRYRALQAAPSRIVLFIFPDTGVFREHLTLSSRHTSNSISISSRSTG